MARVAIRFGLGAIVATGIAAGILFAVFEVCAAAVLMGVGAAVIPLRMIGAMALGPAALDTGYPPEIPVMTGVIVHMLLSIVFAGVFAAIVSPLATTTAVERNTGRRGDAATRATASNRRQCAVTQALDAISREDVNQLPVMEQGELRGVISREHILRLLSARAELAM